MKDHYAILGISPTATPEAIKAAYRRKANLYHPDKNSAEGAALRFREVLDAYEVLSDEGRRKAYDDNRRRSLIEHPETVAQEIWKNTIDRAVA